MRLRSCRLDRSVMRALDAVRQFKQSRRRSSSSRIDAVLTPAAAAVSTPDIPLEEPSPAESKARAAKLKNENQKLCHLLKNSQKNGRRWKKKARQISSTAKAKIQNLEDDLR